MAALVLPTPGVAAPEQDDKTPRSLNELVATSPTTGDIYFYDHETATWLWIGGPHQEYAVDDAGIIQGLNSTGIFELWGGSGWRQIGGPAASIRSGGVGLLVATSITTGDPYLYTGLPFQPWTRIGGPAAKIYTGGNLVVTSPFTGDAYRFHDAELSWEHVGGPGDLFSVANDGTLYGLNSSGIWRRAPGDNDWTQVGGPAATFAI